MSLIDPVKACSRVQLVGGRRHVVLSSCSWCLSWEGGASYLHSRTFYDTTTTTNGRRMILYLPRRRWRTWATRRPQFHHNRPSHPWTTTSLRHRHYPKRLATRTTIHPCRPSRILLLPSSGRRHPKCRRTRNDENGGILHVADRRRKNGDGPPFFKLPT